MLLPMHLRYKLLLPLMALSLTVVQAQYNTKNEWYVGVAGGASLSNVTLVPKLVDKQFAIGNTAGLSIRYISEPHFGLQAEVNYLDAGWQEDQEGSTQPFSYQRQVKMVDVPLLLHAYTGDHIFRGILNVGPRFSYVLSEEETFVDGATRLLHHGKAIESPFQYGLVGGGGFELHLKRLVIGVEGRYTYFLSNLFADAVSDDFNTSSLQVVTINAFIQIQLH